jgi:hypothetical protein
MNGECLRFTPRAIVEFEGLALKKVAFWTKYALLCARTLNLKEARREPLDTVIYRSTIRAAMHLQALSNALDSLEMCFRFLWDDDQDSEPTTYEAEDDQDSIRVLFIVHRRGSVLFVSDIEFEFYVENTDLPALRDAAE